MQERATAGRPRLAGSCSDWNGRRILRGPPPTFVDNHSRESLAIDVVLRLTQYCEQNRPNYGTMRRPAWL
jgi:hypothetical protein